MSRFFSPQVVGPPAAVIAVVMLAFDLSGYTWFRAQLTPTFALPMWILFAAFAGLQYALYRAEKRGLELSDKEVAKWGHKLELATPKILDLYAERTPVRDIAKAIEKTHGIPPDVTLRYIIALARYSGGANPESPG